MKVLANFEDNLKIPTNSSIDNLLNGGFEKGTVTQIFGHLVLEKVIWLYL